MALNIGELFGTIGLDSTAWNRELSSAEGNLKAFAVTGAATAAAAAVAIGAALSKGIADAVDMEAGNDRVQAQLGLTEEQAAISGKAAGSVFSQNFGASLEDVQVGVSAVMSSIKGMRDASQADIEDMTKRVLTLADVFEIDVSRAAQVAGQMITSGFATDGVHAADLLTDALQKVPAAVREDILDAVDEYAPFMAQLGIASETGMGLLVNASEKGMYGIDKLGDALKEFTIRSTDMSKTSGEAYEALGLDQQEMSNKLLAGGMDAQTAFGDIVHGLQGIEDPSARAAAAIALFGTPLEDLGVNEIPEFLGQIDPMGDAFDSVAGASDKAMADVASNAKAGFEGFKRQAQTALIDFVNVNIMPALSQFAGFLNNTVGPAVTQLGAWITTNALPALQAFGGWFSQNQGTITMVATIIGALLIPVFIRLAVQAGMTAAANVTAWTIMGAKAIKTAALYVVNSYKMIGAWVMMGAAAIKSGAQTVAIWTLYKVEAIKGAAVYVAQKARIVGAWVAMSAAAVASGIKTAAVWTGSVIASAAKGAASMAVNAAKVVASWVLMGARAVAQGAIMATGWAIGVIVPAAAAVGAFLVAAGAVLAGWISMAAAATVNAVIMAAAWLAAFWPVALIIAIVVGLVALIIANWDKVKAWTIAAFTAVWTFLQGVWQGIVSTVTTAATAVWNAIQTAFNFVKSIFTTVWNFIVGYYATIWGLLTGQSTGAADQVRQIIANAFEAVKNFITGIWDSIVGFLAGAWANIQSTAVNVFNAIVGFIAGIPGRILSGLSAIAGLAVQMGQWVGSMKDAAVNKFLDLVGWVSGLPGRILDTLGDMGSLLKNAGIQIITGFLDGLKQKYEDVKNFVGGIGDWIADHKGPKAYDLQLLVPAGGWIMTGLDKGLRSQMGMLKGTLGDVSSLIEAGIQPELAVTGSYTGAGGWADQRRYSPSAPAEVSRTVHAPITISDSTTPRATAVKVARVLEGAV